MGTYQLGWLFMIVVMSDYFGPMIVRLLGIYRSRDPKEPKDEHTKVA